MSELSSVCVFCGSKTGRDSRHTGAARQLGQRIAAEGCELVYGAGSIGLMGIIANSVSDAGGRVAGIIPQFLDEWEVGRRHSDEFVVTDSMHQRKQLMSERADAFIVLPGGLGTLDETFEIVTWKQLRLHDKPIVILNVAGYWDRFVTLVDGMVAEGFVAEKHRQLFTIVDQVDEVFPTIRKLVAEKET